MRKLTVKDCFNILRYKFEHNRIKDRCVKVETSAECNARCSWCWMFNSAAKPHGLIDPENFRKFIDLNKVYFLAHRIRIMPFFNGECLVHPKIFEMFDYVVANGLGLTDIDTNFGVNIDVPRLMSYPIKYFRVNIGGITKDVHEPMMKTNFDLVVRNVKEAVEIDPERVIVKMVLTKSNFCQKDKLMGFMEELGGKPENTIVAPTGFALPAMASEKEIKDFFDQVVSHDLDEYLKFEYDLSKPRYDIRAKDKGCHYILNCVSYDGKLTICCQDQLGKIDLGNAFETPIIELIARPEYEGSIEKAKKMQFEFCPECN